MMCGHSTAVAPDTSTSVSASLLAWGWPVGNEESSDICIDPSAQVSERRLKTEDDKGCVIGGATGGKQIDQERVGQLLRP